MMVNDPFCEDYIDTDKGSWKIWAQTIVEWIRNVVRKQKSQDENIKDLYGKYEKLNEKLNTTREEFIKSDHNIDIDVTKIKTELDKSANDSGSSAGKKWGGIIGGMISVIIVVLLKVFGFG
jgi:hypothetical protein